MKKLKVVSKFSDGQVVWVLNTDKKIVSGKCVGFIGVVGPGYLYPAESQVQLEIEIPGNVRKKDDPTIYYENFKESEVFTSRRAIVKHVLNDL